MPTLPKQLWSPETIDKVKFYPPVPPLRDLIRCMPAMVANSPSTSLWAVPPCCNMLEGWGICS